MTKVNLCKNCGAVNSANNLVCWICNTFLGKQNVTIAKLNKNSKALEQLKNSEIHNKNLKYAEIKFNSEGIEGFVYLLQGKNYYKIGKTKSLLERTRTLNIQLPYRCQLVYAIKTNNINSLENYWHRRFGDKRKNGEWFSLTRDDINEFIKTGSQIFKEN